MKVDGHERGRHHECERSFISNGASWDDRVEYETEDGILTVQKYQSGLQLHSI